MPQRVCDPALMEEGELGHDGVQGRLPRGGASDRKSRSFSFLLKHTSDQVIPEPTQEPPHHLQNEAKLTSLFTEVLWNLTQHCF